MLTRDDLIARAVPEGYRIGWKFCWLPALVGGRTVWLRSIPVLQRSVPSVALGISWGHDWATVALLDDPEGSATARSVRKPAPVGDFF
jgi:hypothetical protein